MTTATASRFVIKGINDEQDTCSCCGKTGLQRVVWIEDTDTGDINHFGTSCATRPAKGFGITTKEINVEIRKFEAAQVKQRNDARHAKVLAAIDKAESIYTGGWNNKESPLKPGMFFTTPVDSKAWEQIRSACIAEVQ